MKRCSRCGQEKPLSRFHKDCSKPGGLCYNCKECTNTYKKKWRAENQDKVRKYRRSGAEKMRIDRSISGAIQEALRGRKAIR